MASDCPAMTAGSRPDQPPVFLTRGRRPPVAAWASHLRANTAADELPPGSLLLLYTDGLIERNPRVPGDAALRALLASLTFEDVSEMVARPAPSVEELPMADTTKVAASAAPATRTAPAAITTRE